MTWGGGGVRQKVMSSPQKYFVMDYFKTAKFHITANKIEMTNYCNIYNSRQQRLGIVLDQPYGGKEVVFEIPMETNCSSPLLDPTGCKCK